LRNNQAGQGRSAGRRRWIPIYLFLAGILCGGIVWSIWGGRQGDSVHKPTQGGRDSLSTGTGTDTVSGDRTGMPSADPNIALRSSRRTAVVEAAERIGPAVVSISVVQTRYVRGRRRADPFGFFDRYLPGAIYQERVPGLGSGFIIDRHGVILTNEHVVHDAEEIKVSLTDGRTFNASLIGSDSNYDLAVLKIEGDDLPVAEIGDSDQILVGEWVIALGNPFGFLLNEYQPTVTVGVISAKERDIKPSGDTSSIYKNMIQTDAAINPGNSGGALVNAEGQVIGINTFIFTDSGGSLGIGFAIPINVASRVVDEILQFGQVRQVWTGIAVREISPYLAAYFSIEDRKGLIVWELENDSPADRTGIRIGDIIRRVNGESVWTTAQAHRLIFGASVGDRITLTIDRQGEIHEVEIVLEEQPTREARSG